MNSEISKKNKQIKELKERIKYLEIENRHIKNDHALMKEEYSHASDKYLEILHDFEKSNNELRKKNQLISEQNKEIKQRHIQNNIQKEQLARQNNFLQTLLDSIPNPVYYKDMNNKFLGCNEAFCQLVDLSFAEIINPDENRINSNLSHEAFDDKVSDVIPDNFPKRQEYRLNLHNSARDIVINKAIFKDINRENAGLISVITDITKLKEIEKELKDSQVQLQRAMKSKDKFFSTVTHDLKNLLTILFMSCDAIENTDLELNHEQQKRIIKKAARGFRQFHETLNNLLNWAKSQTGKIPYEPETIDISKITENCVSLLDNFVKEKSISLITDIEDNCIAFADNSMIHSVLTNLLTNAVKFTKPDGFIKLSAHTSSNKCILKVQDNGVGISKEDQARLFKIDENFTRKGTKNESGTGLGLIICKEFIEVNRGSLHLSSELNKGSTFEIHLPTII